MFKHLLETFETMQIAVTFAEAGEPATALRVLEQAQADSASTPRASASLPVMPEKVVSA